MGHTRRHQRSAKGPPQTRLRTKMHKTKLFMDPAQSNMELSQMLRAMGLYAADIHGDGNCLFRALADQYYGSQNHHLQLRHAICDWIERHKDRYEPFVEDDRGLDVHLRNMREPATYGGHLELTAFAHMKRRDVKVIQPGLVYVIDCQSFESMSGGDSSGSQRRLRSNKLRDAVSAEHSEEEDDAEEDVTEGVIYVAYHDWEHFSSVRNLRGPHAGLPHVEELSDATKSRVLSREHRSLSPASTSSLSSASSSQSALLTPPDDASLRGRSPKRSLEPEDEQRSSRRRLDLDGDSDVDDLSDADDLNTPSLSDSPASSPSPPPSTAETTPTSESATPTRPLTRRERKRLGLPKLRKDQPLSAGRIVIPGGRFKRPVVVDSSAGGDRPSPSGDAEWVMNGAGRVDVRGFRELKI